MVFTKVTDITHDGAIPVSVYKSSETGMQVVIGKVAGPIVHGYLVFATEAHDDDGIPHTLEHLCFMGSEDYPYKGVLDLVANRCMASGTNAWTDTDHTCYTMSTAGADGFLNLLPMYMDHCLYPTLKDAAFATEVHHVNGDGEDSGIVYAEMQARENTGESLSHMEFLREMYPGHCGYKSNTGGIMKNLRESTTNEKIKKYHSETYRPENMCVIIAGTIDHDRCLTTLSKYEEKIIAHRKKSPPPPFEKPWQSVVPPFNGKVEKDVLFSSADADNGMTLIGWRGPDARTEYKDYVAITLLVDYLTDTAVAPFQQTFVQNEDPFCSSVSFSFIENSKSCMYMYFESVVNEKRPQLKDTLFKLLKSISDSDEPFDMTRFKSVIHRKKLQLLSGLESSPHYAVASTCIGYFLYGDDPEQFKERFQQIPYVDHCHKQEASFWLTLLRKYFLQPDYVVIQGIPSPDVMKKMSDEEKERTKLQQDKLGKDGLKKKADEVKAAMDENDIKPPDEMLTNVPVPTTDNISFLSVNRSSNDPSGAVSPPLASIPYRFNMDDLKSNFVTMKVLINTSDILTHEQRSLIYIFTDMVTETAVERNGVLVPYEDIVTQLADDTIDNQVSIGVARSFTQVLLFYVKVEQGKYLKGVTWLKELIFQTRFTEERINVAIKKLLNELAMEKRKGPKVNSEMMSTLVYKPEANVYACGTFRQITFLNNLAKELKEDAQKVIDRLHKFRDSLLNLDNFIVHVSMDLASVKAANPGVDLFTPWVDTFLPTSLRQSTVNNKVTTRAITPGVDLIKDPTESSGLICGVGSVESNYMQQVVASIRSPLDPDLPSLMVLIQYLTQLEGPMWRLIRGKGLSYHYSIQLTPSDGLLYFVLFKSAHLNAAYMEAVNITKKYINGEEKWDDSLLVAARSSLCYEIIDRERSIPKLQTQSLLSYLRGLPITYTRDLVKKVSSVTIEDMKRVGPKYLLPLFEPINSRRAAVVHPSKVEEVVGQFKEIGVQLNVVSLEEENVFSKL